MNFEQKMKTMSQGELWAEYCGFLDLDIAGFMRIQNRLMEEQISLWSSSGLATPFLRGRKFDSIEAFRKAMPLTRYEDYADVLLQKQASPLPAEPIVWVQTTWEGGRHPYKVAPYTEGMLETFRNNMVACLVLATSTERGRFKIRPHDSMLYALAPLPYVTGLLPVAMEEEIQIDFLPSVKEAATLSFTERNKKGFKLGMKRGGIDFFFGLGSVAYYVSQGISSIGSVGQSGQETGGSFLNIAPNIALRYLKAKRICQRERRSLKPKDLFSLKGLVVAGTDNACYKDDLEDMWGIRPMELFAGTEPSCIGTETWNRDGMYFFPDTCFYEFIPQNEMMKSIRDPHYQPQTYLMDEVFPGEVYELVISVLRGGAFMRYRVGDVYRCVGLEHLGDQTQLPRFQYIDRVPNVIDVAGFTRITQYTIESAIELSGLQIEDWIARKQYSENNRPYIYMIVELGAESLTNAGVSKELLREHLSIYFKHIDQDYQDLKRLLGIEPLEISIVPCGTFARYRSRTDKPLDRINPSIYDVKELLRI